MFLKGHEWLQNHCHGQLMSVCVYACRLTGAQAASGKGPSGLDQAQPEVAANEVIPSSCVAQMLTKHVLAYVA